MKTYFDCWAEVAAALFSQALAGEPELAESLPKPLGAGSFGWAATLAGDVEGRFAVLLDGAVLETPLVGEGVDQKAGWKELVRETFDAAAGELLARTGKKCQVASSEEIAEESQVSQRLSAPLAATGHGRFWCGMSCAPSMPEAPAGSQGTKTSGAQRECWRNARRGAGFVESRPELPASNCCSMSNSKPRCALARARCRSARFSIWGPAMWWSSIAMWPIPWT